MLSGEGSQNGERTTIGLISKKTTLHVQHCTLFLYISLPFFFCTTTTRNFQKLRSYTFYGAECRSCCCSIFFTHSFLPWWPLGFLIFSLPLKNFHVVLPTNSSLSSALALCRSFSRWNSLACRPLYFFSIFQICGHDNYKDTETISAFCFRLYWLFSCLCCTRRGWLCDFPPKYTRVAFGLPYLLVELFYIGIPVVRTDGRDYQNFSDG